MRIVIVTQQLMHNYGGTLQAYAMQEVLRRFGHVPVTIDFLPPRMSKWRYVAAQVKTMLYRLCFSKKRQFFKFPQREKRLPEFANFMAKYIVLTDTVKKYRASILKKYNAEAIVVGSDQVWRRSFYNAKVYPDMFLRFAKNIAVPKIAYAASFGVSEWQASEDLTEVCSYYAKQFTAISTREASGVELCKKYLGVDAVWVPDPTLLLDSKDYENLCKDIPRESRSYLLTYLLDITDLQRHAIEKFANRHGMHVKFVTAEKNVELSVEQWLAMFRDASFVITNSFHGTVFSIINNKDFYTIVNESRGTERFVSLLSHFDLIDRICDIACLPESLIHIEWGKVNKLKTEWQKQGIDFLKSYLK